VIVDYKTDDTARRSIDDLVAHYAPQVQAYAAAWSALTGQPVGEAGLFFVHDGRYRTVPLETPPNAGGQLHLFRSAT
jgi:ATP-dependent helicase/nuclease subunit A